MKYDAFISYSHAKDRSLAASLQTALTRFGKRWYQPRALKIFRDASSLAATPGLWTAIETALGEARRFVLFASPTSAASEWVAKEIEWWLQHRSADKIFIVLTDGKLEWDAATNDFDWSKTDSLPNLLSGRFSEEPLYVDLSWCQSDDDQNIRHSRFRGAVLDLAAPLHGIPKDELDSEEIRQNRKVRILASGAVALLVVLAIGATIAAFVAVQQQRVAVTERERADEERDTAIAREYAARARLADSAGYPGRALLLAAEAATVRSPVEAGTEQALRDLLATIGGKPTPAPADVDSNSAHNAEATWQVADGRLLDRTLQDHAGYALVEPDQRIREHWFSPEENFLVIALRNDSMQSFQLSPGEAPIGRQLSRPPGLSLDQFTTFSPQGEWFLSWNRDLAAWPLTTPAAVVGEDESSDAVIDPIVFNDRWVRWVRFNPAGDAFVTSGYEESRLYRISTELEEIELADGLNGLGSEFSEDSRWLFAPPHLYRVDDGPAAAPARMDWPERRRVGPSAEWRFLRGGEWLLVETVLEVRLWHIVDNVASPEPKYTLQGHHEFSEDGRWLIVHGTEATVLVDLQEGTETSIAGPPVVAAKFSPDQNELVMARRDGAVEIVDPTRPSTPRQLGVVLGAERVEYSPLGRWVLIEREYYGGRTLLAVDEANTRRLEIAAGGLYGDTEFSQDDNWLIVSSDDGTLQKYDLRHDTDSPADETMRAHEGRVGFNFANEGDRLLSGTGSSRREWNLARPSNAAAPLVLDCDGTAQQAAFSPDGQWVAAQCTDRRLGIWRFGDDLLTAFDSARDVASEIEFTATENITGPPIFSKDGRWVAFAGVNRRTWVVDLTATPLEVQEYPCAKPRLGPNGRWLAMMSRLEPCIYDLGDTPDPDAQSTIETNGTVESVAFAANGDLVLVRRNGGEWLAHRHDLNASPPTQRQLLRSTREPTLDEQGRWLCAMNGTLVDMENDVTYQLPPTPHPSTYREVHPDNNSGGCVEVSADGRWAVPVRTVREGYPERLPRHYRTWQTLHDLSSPNPEQPVLSLPEPQDVRYASFVGEAWLVVQENDDAHRISLGAGTLNLESLGPLSLEQFEKSPGGDWLLASEGDELRLAHLGTDGMTIETLADFDAGTSSGLNFRFEPDDAYLAASSNGESWLWRTRPQLDIYRAVVLPGWLLDIDGSGQMLATRHSAGLAIHPLDIDVLVQLARQTAGREFTETEAASLELP